MKYINLSKGFKAMVDDEDFEELNKFKWCVGKDKCNHYALRIIKNENGIWSTISMHKFLMKTPSNMKTDHIDGDGLNNCRSNLRIVTHRQNMQNLHIKKSSIYPGVSKGKKENTWISYIFLNSKLKYLGTFKNELNAHNAYLKELELHNEIFVSNLQIRG